MIVMINGPFGIGKTSSASILKEKIKNSIIYDPEEVGYMLRNIITDEIKFADEKTGDFQDIRIWKKLTTVVAEQLIKTYKKNLIIPMTIWNVDRLIYIRKKLEEFDETVFHFCLLASNETIVKRLLKRGEELGSWPFQQIEKCLNHFEKNSEVFDKVLRTDDLSVEEVCQCIMSEINLIDCCYHDC